MSRRQPLVLGELNLSRRLEASDVATVNCLLRSSIARVADVVQQLLDVILLDRHRRLGHQPCHPLSAGRDSQAAVVCDRNCFVSERKATKISIQHHGNAAATMAATCRERKAVAQLQA